MGEKQENRKRGWNGPPPPRRGSRGYRIDLKGQTFGKLTVLSHAGSDAFGHARWNCLCECGEPSTVLGINLPKTLSCGCAYTDKTGYKKLSTTEVQALRCDYAAGVKQNALAVKFQVSRSAVSKLFKGQYATNRAERDLVQWFQSVYRKTPDPSRILGHADAERIFGLTVAGGSQ